jgi:hypothetical protein
VAFNEIGCGLDPSGSEELHVSSCNYSNTFRSSTVGGKLFSHLSNYQFRIVLYIITDLMNALPGNSSVNTVQQATIDEALFSISSAPSSGGRAGLCNPFLRNCLVNTLPRNR